jgi:hypothetical protein
MPLTASVLRPLKPATRQRPRFRTGFYSPRTFFRNAGSRANKSKAIMLCVFPPPWPVRQQEDRRACASAQMPERSVHQREHGVGEVVFLEELRTVDLSLEEGIEVENRGTAVRSENGWARLAKGVEVHGRFGPDGLKTELGMIFVGASSPLSDIKPCKSKV